MRSDRLIVDILCPSVVAFGDLGAIKRAGMMKNPRDGGESDFHPGGAVEWDMTFIRGLTLCVTTDRYCAPYTRHRLLTWETTAAATRIASMFADRGVDLKTAIAAAQCIKGFCASPHAFLLKAEEILRDDLHPAPERTNP